MKNIQTIIMLSLFCISSAIIGQEPKPFISVFGMYDSRLGDIWSGSFFSTKNEKAHWFGGGIGAYFIKGVAEDAEKSFKDQFEYDYGGLGKVDVEKNDINSFNVFYAYFPDFKNIPGYIGISYSSVKSDIVSEVNNSNKSVTSKWSASSIDIICGYAILKQRSFLFDIRLGYGVSLSEDKIKVEVENYSSEYDAGESFMKAFFLGLSLGYSF